MRKVNIEEVVIDQKELLDNKDLGLSRLVNKNKLLSTKQIVVISGIRRSGKSTLFYQIMKHFQKFYYLNFDDERLINFEVADFQELMIIYKKQYPSNIVFFDEIQNVEGWERFVRRIFDEGYKIFITGSNAKLLSSELATHLTGRYIKIELFPFSLNELLSFYKIDKNKLTTNIKVEILKLFDLYMENGGFPEFHKYQDTEFLTRVYEDIIYKDLIVRYKIKNVNTIKNLSQYLFTNLSKGLSYSSLKNILNIKSTNTVSNYVSFLQESYLVFELFKFNFSLKKQYTSNKKFYVIDTGIRNLIAFKFSDDLGKLLENIVFIELKRRQKDVFFYKTRNNKEVDFIYRETDFYHLFQVSYSLDGNNTRNREVKSLIEADAEIPNCKHSILTYNDEETIVLDDIRIQVVPIWKWLLAE
ncbi:MAG: ATP-binding protein [Bacteroidota bacterium]|nr:ATP-binding protein [Bacteroidota bacterium]